MNVVVGGDSLGRGLTFPRLQTVYYFRSTKTPQADTLWQHARMFGYDRRPELMRVFMPKEIASNFQMVHHGNEAIKRQIKQRGQVDDIHIVLPGEIRPTRPSVINRKFQSQFVGGHNYFASDPRVKDFEKLDSKLDGLVEEDGEVQIDIRGIVSLLDCFEADLEDFPVEKFKSALNLCRKQQVKLKGISGGTGWLRIRRNRKITQGTGTLLSETDRVWSETILSKPVLILYRIEGEDLGWQQSPTWVPNLKLPGDAVYYYAS